MSFYCKEYSTIDLIGLDSWQPKKHSGELRLIVVQAANKKEELIEGRSLLKNGLLYK